MVDLRNFRILTHFAACTGNGLVVCANLIPPDPLTAEARAAHQSPAGWRFTTRVHFGGRKLVANSQPILGSGSPKKLVGVTNVTTETRSCRVAVGGRGYHDP
jgi:hypothetical protein